LSLVFTAPSSAGPYRVAFIPAASLHPSGSDELLAQDV